MVRVSSPVAPGAGKFTWCVAGVTVMPASLLTTVRGAEVEAEVYRSPGQTAVMEWVPTVSVGLKVAVAIGAPVEETARVDATTAILEVPSKSCTYGVYSSRDTPSTPETVADNVMLLLLAVKTGPVREVVVGSGVTVIVNGAEVTAA
jgi:hypothetical protein